MKLVIERDTDGSWLCNTDPWAWAYGFGGTPEEAVADLRSTLCEMRDMGWLRDRDWSDRHGAQRALDLLEGRVRLVDRWRAIWARIVRWWVE